YFDPDGLILAEDDDTPLGFSHAGFGPNLDETALDTTNGVVCALAVREGHRRRGIGTELLRRAEEYLLGRGARSLHAAPMRPLEPIEFRLEDKTSGLTAARALVWEMEGYGWRWNQPAAGVLEIQVRPELRRLGLAKFLLAQLLRYLQDQYFGIVEVQSSERNQ